MWGLGLRRYVSCSLSLSLVFVCKAFADVVLGVQPIPSRGVECSISGSLRKPAKAGVMDDLPRGTELYPFFVQNEGVVHLLAASTEGERREWMGALDSVRGA